GSCRRSRSTRRCSTRASRSSTGRSEPQPRSRPRAPPLRADRPPRAGPASGATPALATLPCMGSTEAGAVRGPSRVRRAVRALAVDVQPLRASRDYRLIWTGLLVSEFGYQFTLVATFIQVKRLTGSAAAVGVIGLVGLAGLVVGTLGGGSLLDAHDRRTLLIVAQIGFMAASGVLLLGAVAGSPPIWLIYAAVAALAGFSAIDGPTRSAMTPRLVGADLLPAALALNQVIWNGTALVGPALAGIVIDRLGLSFAYGIDLVTYLAMLGAAILIRPIRPQRAEGAATGWAAVREGFAYLKGRRVLQSTF